MSETVELTMDFHPPILTLPQIADLVDHLVRCGTVSDPVRRHRFVAALSFGDAVDNDPQTYAHCLNVLTTCLERQYGLTELLAVLAIYERETESLQAVYEKLNYLIRRQIGWTDVMQLQKMLPRGSVEDAAAEKAFVQVMGEPPPPRCPSGYLFWGCLDLLAMTEHGPDRAPLLEFLLSCHGQYEAHADVEAFDNWLNRIAGPLNVDVSALQGRLPRHKRPPAGAAVSLLQIKVSPVLRPDERVTHFHVQAWPYGAPNTRPLCAALERQDAFTSAELPALIGEIVRGFDEYATNRDGFLTIEVVLPVALLGSDIGGWMYPDEFDPYPLSSLHTVLVRPWERHYLGSANARWLWRTKWNRLPFHPKTLVDQQILWACEAEALPTNLPAVLRGRDLVPVAVQMKASMNDDPRPLKDFVLTGLPVALWLREFDGESEAVRRELGQLICGRPLDDLPEILRQKRQEVHSSPAPDNEPFFTFWNKITLLWDDPNRLPHDAPGALKTNLTSANL